MMRGEYDSAGAMFRKTLEVALKGKDPDTSGMLAKRIKSLAEKGILTADLAIWANEIKELGNPAVHDEDEPHPEDVQKLAGLTEMVLRYIYTLPGMVAAKRTALEEVVDS